MSKTTTTSKARVSPFTSVSRMLVAGAVFFTVLLIAAAILTDNLSQAARSALTRDGRATNSQLQAADEIDALLGRGGLSGRLMIYATQPNPDTLALMAELVAGAEGELANISITDQAHSAIFAQAAQARIAESELAIVALGAGTRDPALVAIEFADGMASFDTALNRFRAMELQAQTAGAIAILDLQRWITGIALILAIIVMASAAALFWFGIRRPLRKLADHLEDLMVDEEKRELPEAARSDEIGDVARIAAQIRRAQLQAGRLLTFGPDGALRLRLEGDGADAVDDALGELRSAADAARTSAQALTGAESTISENSEAAMARLEAALDETIAETSGQLQSLSDAGENVIRLAGDLEGARRSFAGTEEEWRNEMVGLGETMRGEFDRLHGTADRLAQVAETAVGRTEVASSRLDHISAAWAEDQARALAAGEDARAGLAARIEGLDVHIEALGSTLQSFEELSGRTISPVDAARDGLLRSVLGLSEAAKEAAVSTGFWSKEVEAARAARDHAATESEADRAYWKKERQALRLQIDTAMNDLVDTAAKVSSFAKDLNSGAGDLPARFDGLQQEINALGQKIGTFENTGSDMIGKLGGQLTAVHDALQDARDAFYRESVTIGEVTGDLKSLHLSFDAESRAIGEQVALISDSLETLDESLSTLTDRLASPVDLSPVLAALRNEMGRAVTHLSQVVEGQSQQTRASFTAERSAVVGQELAEFSEALEARISLEAEQTAQLMATMDGLREQLESHDDNPPTSAIIEPRLISIGETTRAIAQEVRAIGDKLTSIDGGADGEIMNHIGRVERLQSGLSRAQQAIATSMQEGLSGIVRHLRSSDSDAATQQIERSFATLTRQQIRLDDTLRETISELGGRIDSLAVEIARSSTPITRPDMAEVADGFGTGVKTGAKDRVSDVQPPEEADLSAIYDALRGLTEELKDLSVDTSDASAPDDVDERQAS